LAINNRFVKPVKSSFFDKLQKIKFNYFRKLKDNGLIKKGFFHRLVMQQKV